jgi:NAD(P)-dependent dehydrogenase (short-subunit alcohol dehydrogenase family)
MTASRTILVTGAGSGIGLASALHLARSGYHVYATVPVPEQEVDVQQAAAEWNVSLRVLQLDVTDEASINQAVEVIMAEVGGIYGVVHSAGLGLRGFFEDIADHELRRLFDVNVFGVMSVTRAVLPHMRAARRGRIVIISSSGGRIASMSLSGYCAGKFAIEGFGETLAMEVAPFGITVSLIEPGLVMTPHFTVHRGRARAAMEPSSPYYQWFVQHERMVDEVLRTNRITPADVAGAVYQAITAKRPRLRYVVGWRAKLLIALRRRLPGVLFDRAYSRQMQRTVIDAATPAARLDELAVPGEGATDYLGFSRDRTA